jgi:type III restriction enzyme
MKIQIEHLQHQTDAIKQTIKSINEKEQSHFTIEMETGTGKTFTFISTIFELYKEFNHKKFIIVAPRVAIKEGIYKTFEVFQEYFKDKYNNIQYNVSNYDSGKMNVISNFINGNDLQILILTKQSFDKETNKLRQDNRDELFGLGSYIERIKEIKPIVIIDEPQLNKDFNSKQLLELLNPQFVLSYSATHPKENPEPIYKYTPDQAYNDRQVKRLEYLAIELEGGINASFQLESADLNKKTAKIKYNNKSYSLKSNDNLGKKTEDKSLNDFVVKYVTQGDIFFTNGKKFSQLIEQSANEETILREQIKQTILQHKEKEQRLKNEGIKQMSLFFVPSVADFVDDGIVKRIFLEEYKNIYSQEEEGRYAYYFSNGKGTKDAQEKEMTKLILKDREELLSLNNKVEFIFAHTSLGVGWDNPNIFNICFLRHIASESNKKQFVGRGLRLCVNKEGKRVFEGKEINDIDRINNLTIIGSMQYESFCSQYQQEAGWNKNNQSQIGDATKKISKQIKIKQDKKDLAKELWKRLKPKTNWYINFKNLDKFYENIITELRNEVINQKTISITKGDIKGNVNDFQSQEIIENFDINNIIAKIKEKTWLSVSEIKRILNEVNEKEIRKNQEAFINITIKTIERCRKNHIMSIAEVIYEKTGENFDDEHFIQEERKSYHENLMESEKSLFNLVDFDSNQEKKFVKLADNTESVELLVKLPKGSEDKFHINTPIGKYTPDFALLVNGNNKLYMIFEVKSKKPKELDDKERFKIQCAVKHFEQLGFDVATEYIDHKGSDMLEISKFQQDCYSVYVPNEK